MDYVLIILLQFRQFKGSFKLNLFSDDFFLDELSLDEPIDLRKDNWPKQEFHESYQSLNENYDSFYSVYTGGAHVDDYCPCPRKIFMYQLNGNCLRASLNFNINDSNSNYTNGFMNKSNMIMFERIYLLPKKCLQASSVRSLFDRYPQYIDSLQRQHRKGLSKAYFDSNASRYRIAWPSNMISNASGVDTHIDYSIPQQLQNHFWYGGKKDLYIPLTKKHGVHMMDCNRFSRPTDVPTRVTVDQLFWHHLTHYKLINT